jgi:hypothetical protein
MSWPLARRCHTMQACPCCRQPTHFELLPDHRRLGSICTQFEHGSAAASAPASAQHQAKHEHWLPLKADRVDPSRHGRPTGSYGSFEGLRNPKDPADFSPFRITHTDGPDAEPSALQKGSHGGPDKEWYGFPVAGDQQFQTPW